MKSFKKNSIYLLIIVFVLLFNTVLFAKTKDVRGVRFKDGSVVYGTIIKMNINKVIILTKDNEIITKEFDDIVEFIKDTTTDAKIDQMNLTGRSAFGVRTSYVNYSDDSYFVYGVEVNTELDDAPMFGLNYSYFLTNHFSIELSVDYIEPEVTLSAPGLSGKGGKLKQVPLLLVGRLNVPIKNKAIPYIGGGVGYFFYSFDQENYVIEYIYGSGAKIDIDNSYGFLFNGGIDLFLTKNIALNFDVKYIWNDIEAKVNKPGFTEEDFDANMFIIGGGLKYYF